MSDEKNPSDTPDSPATPENPTTPGTPDEGEPTGAMSLEDIAAMNDPAAEDKAADKAAGDGPADDDGESTQAMSAIDVRAAKIPLPPLGAPRTKAAPPAATGTTDPLDTLFRDDKFQEPSTEASASGSKKKKKSGTADAAPSNPWVQEPEVHRPHTVLLGIAGALTAILILLGAYLLGTNLGEQSAENTAAEATPTPTPTPTPRPGTGPVDPGDYDWDDLRGGECVDPFFSAWEEEFTVVDCEDPHAAQVLLRGEFSDAATAAYPGTDALLAQAITECSSESVLDFAIAGQVNDIQISASVPATESSWEDGLREYYCFVARGSGEALPGDMLAAENATEE